VPQLPNKVAFFARPLSVPEFIPLEFKVHGKDQSPLVIGKLQRSQSYIDYRAVRIRNGSGIIPQTCCTSWLPRLHNVSGSSLIGNNLFSELLRLSGATSMASPQGSHSLEHLDG
jgi:hypothetical protein